MPRGTQITGNDRRIGERVRRLREARSLSQSDLGRRLGISFQQIQKYEKGTNRISAGRLFEVAQVFGVETTYFFEGLASAPPRSIAKAEDVQRASLRSTLSRIKSANVRRRLVKLIEVLSSP